MEHSKQLVSSTNKANNSHIEYLSNFVRHDMKNAIQGLDGIIYNAAETNKINVELHNQLKTAMSLLRSSLDNFAKLIPSSQNQTTTLPDILNAVEMLSRYDIQSNKIDAKFDYDRTSKVSIPYSFQSLVQILHNFILNAKNAFRNQEEKKLYIKGRIDSKQCQIKIYDNAPNILEKNRNKIFEYGYSTTNGSGIGLFHAKNVVSKMGGAINVFDSDLNNYKKFFIIEFPIQSQNI